MRHGSHVRVGMLWVLSATAAVLSGCASDPAPKARCHGRWVVLPGPADPVLTSSARESGANPAKNRAAERVTDRLEPVSP